MEQGKKNVLIYIYILDRYYIQYISCIFLRVLLILPARRCEMNARLKQLCCVGKDIKTSAVCEYFTEEII